jgi:hypothetical protein
MKTPWNKDKPKQNIDALPLITGIASMLMGVVVAVTVKQLTDALINGKDMANLLEDRDIASRALINTGLPLPMLKLGEGEILAFREWGIEWDKGVLTGTNHHQTWGEITFADTLPMKDNTNGLYAVKLDAVGFCEGQVRSRIPISPSDKVNCCGLVGLRGIVVEHEDGVLRAEYARVLCIWVTTSHSVLYDFLPKLYDNYPNIPIFVCTRKQVIKTLFTITTMLESQCES